ncbi:MAG: alkaline phosphatase family protein [Blastocatellia bacterium]|nr:alkaline phosphatase family protein [Blastocatellia bacterium]
MRRRVSLAILLLLPALFAPSGWNAAQSQLPAPVVLISIDGLQPAYVIEADKHGLKIPNLRRLLVEGAHASGVRPALPTVTYPNHTTMVTGVSPARHGIIANTPFDPLSKNQGGWYWYAEDIRVPTLWDACASAGLATASVDWPVTVGANITYNIAQYWRAGTPDDLKIIRALSTPGLLTEAERALGPYPEGNDYTLAADRRRAAFNVFLLEQKKPRFLTCYFSGLDTEQHSSGPYSRETFAALEEIDELVGEVRKAAEKTGGGRAVICVVSDHGFVRTDRAVHINSALREAGLIQFDDKGKVKSWQAYAWNSGGSAAVMLENPKDDEARKKAEEALKRLAGGTDKAVHQVLDQSEIRKSGGFPGAAFVVCLSAGFRTGGNLQGPSVTAERAAGTHGYCPEIKEMDATFLIAGSGVPSGRALGRIDMRDVAPTLAALLGIALPSAEGRDLLKK